MKEVILNDGVKIPSVGFGVFLIPADGTTYKAVRQALDAGYRHIDTAAAYFNEQEVGKAIKDSGIDRKEIFVTSKLWLQDYGYEHAKYGIEQSLKKLDTGYIDLYLLHQPYGDVEGAWRALEEYKEKGLLRSIGVSNMTPKLYEKFVPSFKTKPSVNQVECNPTFLQRELQKTMQKDGVKIEAWYPLAHGDSGLLNNPVITKIAEKYGKNAGQIILRFEIQEGFIVLPKSTNPERIKGNIDIFDFSLTDEEIKSIETLDTGKGTHDPDNNGVEYYLSKLKVHELW